MQTVVLPLTIFTLLVVTARAWKARSPHDRRRPVPAARRLRAAVGGCADRCSLLPNRARNVAATRGRRRRVAALALLATLAPARLRRRGTSPDRIPGCRFAGADFGLRLDGSPGCSRCWSAASARW
jgi:hypothetical protein